MKIMENKSLQNFIKDVLKNMPLDWLNLTTHRLDIYNESLAKVEFINQFDNLYKNNLTETTYLINLPTAYDYIRLGHPLSCILEWTIAKMHNLKPKNVISFSSKTMPILAILRKNLLNNKNTQIFYKDELPTNFNAETLNTVYGYNFELVKVLDENDIIKNNSTTIFITNKNSLNQSKLNSNIDFYINFYDKLGSIILSNNNTDYISEIQHVRRRESIAMTPINCLTALNSLSENKSIILKDSSVVKHKNIVLKTIKEVTGTISNPIVGSSGLSIQYAIMMGAIDEASKKHPEKAIKIIVPPNCYGGTNDQARRVAACNKNVEIIDLPVDGDNDMVKSINLVLDTIAKQDALPYIIAEIPTNPRVEVPDLIALKEALSKERKTEKGNLAVDPVFILDQTFCPNIQFLGAGKILSEVRAISYASGSKFPSGGKCTAGYVVGNSNTSALLSKIENHIKLCDNEATDLQLEILATQLPSMLQRIKDAYYNTREFVSFIKNILPKAKINFVSEKLASQGFTPSVFSLDLPTKGKTDEEKETYKRELNLRLINLMINKIPKECKYCVSYGQLKGSYWTIPATSTQGTTKESDKDYIARISLSPKLDLEKHKKVFTEFVNSI